MSEVDIIFSLVGFIVGYVGKDIAIALSDLTNNKGAIKNDI